MSGDILSGIFDMLKFAACVVLPPICIGAPIELFRLWSRRRRPS